jgi:hypothetical protein
VIFWYAKNKGGKTIYHSIVIDSTQVFAGIAKFIYGLTLGRFLPIFAAAALNQKPGILVRTQ